MSIRGILAAAPNPTTAPVPDEWGAGAFYVALAAATLFSIVLLLVLRAWEARRVVGPLRVEPGRPLWPLLVASVIGVVVWLGTQTGIGVWKQLQLFREHGPDRRLEMSDFTPGDFAVLATVPGVAGFLCLLAGNRFAGQWTVAWLGFGRRHILAGMAGGLVGTVAVLPLMQWVGIALETLYTWIQYEHPKEHDLLRVILEAPSPWAKWLLIAGAVLVAPFFEEYLFRGHLQTLLRQVMLRASHPRERGFEVAAPPPPATTPAPSYPAAAYAPPALPAAGPMVHPPAPGGWGGPTVAHAGAEPSFPPVLPPPSTPPPDARPIPDTLSVWPPLVAILVTSLCFSVVHPMWTWPVIFVLSCFLGYAYERTGNLWTCVTIHAAFNGFSTIVYLTLIH